MVHFDKKKREGKAIYMQAGLSVQKGLIKYTLAPNKSYRPKLFVLNSVKLLV